MAENIYFLSGDVGGTKARLHMYQLKDDGSILAVANEVYPSRKYSHLKLIISEFLNKLQLPCAPLAACIAMAGPVKNNCCFSTNLNWTLDGWEMGVELKIKRFMLINDFVGIGYGLLALRDTDRIQINPNAVAQVGAPIACLGAGTGLGEVYLTHNKKHYDVWPSEGGHADYAPRNDLEFDLLKFIRTQEAVQRVSVERVVSGLGMPRIYDFLASRSPHLINAEITRAMQQRDPGSVITKSGLGKKDMLCQQTLELLISNYGAEAGNLAIKTLCFGGLYVAGGVAPRVCEYSTPWNKL